MFRVGVFCLSLLAIATVSASSGDRASGFQACTSACVGGAPDAPTCTLPLALQLTQWMCLDDCRYKCMHAITEQAMQHGGTRRIHQYFGKWPFVRLAGMQEPASVLFSVLNLIAHVRGAALVRNKVPDGHPMKPFYLAWAFVGVNAWIWSAVFHTRGPCLGCY